MNILKVEIDYLKIPYDVKSPFCKIRITFWQAVRLLIQRRFFVRVINAKSNRDQ